MNYQRGNFLKNFYSILKKFFKIYQWYNTYIFKISHKIHHQGMRRVTVVRQLESETMGSFFQRGRRKNREVVKGWMSE